MRNMRKKPLSSSLFLALTSPTPAAIFMLYC